MSGIAVIPEVVEIVEVVNDPVGHISISGVHGRDELNERLAHARTFDGNRARRTSSIGSLLLSAAVGAAVMYLFDPERGKLRRSLLRDQIVHTLNSSADRLGKVRRDARNRAIGAVAEVRNKVTHDDADEVVIADRVRAALGRVVSHPSSIVVGVAGGEVTLGGPVLASEVESLLSTTRGVRGVSSVVSRLDVHQSAGNIPGLQDATT